MVPGFFRTWWAVMTGPRTFFRRAQGRTRLSDPLLYAAVVLLSGRLGGMLISVGNIARADGDLGSKRREFNALLVNWAAMLPLLALSSVLACLLLHGACRVAGVHPHGLRATVRVYLYALSPSLLAPLTCFAGSATIAASWAILAAEFALTFTGLIYACGARPWRLAGAILLGPLMAFCLAVPFVALYNFFAVPP